MDTEIFQEVEIRHLALTQFFRWYQVYERPFNEFRIRNQLDILDDDIIIATLSESEKGKPAYREKLKRYEGYLNAHHILGTKIELLNSNMVQLSADIIYQCKLPNYTQSSHGVKYTTKLKLNPKCLPRFTEIKLIPQEKLEGKSFKDAYPYNRCSSFMHYWLYLIETAKGRTDAFKELFANKFELNFNGHLIADFSQFEQWLAGASKVKRSAHFEKNFVAAENADGSLKVNVEFEWKGLSGDGRIMTGATKHEWLLENNLDSRFPKVRKMTVQQLVPFH